MLLKATEFLKLIEERKTSQLWQNLVKKWTDTYEYICPLLAEPARHASFRSDERMGTAWLGWDEGCIEVHAPTARTYVNEDNTIKYQSYGTDEEVINAEIEKVLSELEMGVREDTFVQICIDRNTAGMDLTLSKKNFFYTDFRMSVLKFDSVNPHFSNLLVIIK